MARLEDFKGQIEWVDVGLLIPYPMNGKKHPKEQIEKIANQIHRFGWDQPIVIDEDSVILKGMGRREAALHLGLAQVPILRRTDLSPEEKVAIRIADNAVAESEWDYDKLKVDFEFLKNHSFEMEFTGFDYPKINSIVDGWQTDIKDVENAGENTEGIISVIKVTCPQEMKEELRRFLTERIAESGLIGVEIE